ncbi:MAG: twin-arginine translocation signal domain-containing protein, partial [Phycisphaerae bacterium]
MNHPALKLLQRRDLLKAASAAAVAAMLGSLSGCGNTHAGVGEPNNNSTIKQSDASGTHNIDPLIGTGWHGHTFPGATAPFSLVQLSPDTAGPPEAKWSGNGMNPYGWDHCPGYHYPDDVVKGFSHTHLSGTGGKDLGDVLLMPVVEGRNWSWEALAPGKQHADQIAALGPNSGWVSRGGGTGYSSSFSHQQETARAGYYSVYLQTPRVKAELTATTRCGMHRYTYPSLPQATRRGVILDLVHGLGCTVYHAQLNIENPTTISGKRYTHGWAADKQVYFVMEFSHPIAEAQVQVDDHIRAATAPDRFSGTHIKAIFSHAHSSKPLLVRVGLSCTGIEG